MAIYEKLKKLHDKNGEVEFEAEIPAPIIEEHMTLAAREAAEDLSVPGFRKGKVPEHIAREHVGEMYLLEAAADAVLHAAIREIAEDEELRAIGKPQLIITKIAPKNPLGFKVRFALYPDISLPDYKKIAAEVMARKESTDVTDKDIEDAILRLRQMLADPTGKNQGTAPLPEVNDEFVKKLGPFKDLAAFREELKKQLAQEKESNNKDLKRDLIVKEIVDRSKIKIPSMLVEQELEDFAANRTEELKHAGITMEDYLKQIGKTSDALVKEERGLIEDQIKTSLVFSEIRKKEDLKPSEREVQINMARLKLRYPDRDEHSLRETAEAVAMQEELFRMLEGSDEKPEEKETSK